MKQTKTTDTKKKKQLFFSRRARCTFCARGLRGYMRASVLLVAFTALIFSSSVGAVLTKPSRRLISLGRSGKLSHATSQTSSPKQRHTDYDSSFYYASKCLRLRYVITGGSDKPSLEGWDYFLRPCLLSSRHL